VDRVGSRPDHDDARPLADVQPGARHPAKGAYDTAIGDRPLLSTALTA
jgi:hypothetical protein